MPDADLLSWQRPPFEPGNEAAVTHGARSERRWRPIADRLAAELLAERPWLAGHRRSVDAWARVTAQIELISEWLDTVGLWDEDGELRGAVNQLDRLESRAASLRADLCEPPMAMAKLLNTLTSTAVTAGAKDTLEALAAEGRQLVAAYEAAGRQVTQPSPAELSTAERGVQPPEEEA